MAEVLDGRHATVDVLRNHARWLAAEQERLAALARTVSRTIEELEGGYSMKMEELFEGNDADRQARYEAELVERYGEGAQAHIDEGKQRMQSWTKADAEGFMAEWREIGAVRRAVRRGRRARLARGDGGTDRTTWLCRSWTPNRESYTGLGQLYVDAPDFKSQFDAHAEGFAEYVRDAMAAYAQARL
ncbi:TipAS antibiotic-recognition domain-containing protein [Saccharothrix sp. MB29]|nr:TipAS antibiotic-recognition domain-containing protein [Saccharothrix sp. MB29]